MKQSITHIALVVSDYDETVEFHTENLGFILLDDTPQSETKREVKVAPQGAEECCLLLAKGVGNKQRSRIGNQTGGLWLHNLWLDISLLKKRKRYDLL